MATELLRISDCVRRRLASRNKLYQMIATGELPHIRVGRAIRIPSDALDRWIEAKTKGGLEQ